MAKQPGRLVLVKVDTTGAGVFATIGGGQTKSLTINNEQVDVTNSDSTEQFRELLESAGVKSMSISIKGVFDDDAAFNKVVDYSMGGLIKEFQFVVPGLGTFEGLFLVASVELSGEYKGAAQYSSSFESAGVIILTP